MAKYEPTSFFFTDYSALSAPTAADAFGPVAGNLTTQYRTTSFVNGTGKLYAICDGQLLIQPQTGSTSKVNLILKPGKSYNGPKVKYFIYRNVNMSDLINGNNLVDKNDSDPNQPDILKRIWKEFLDFNMPFYNQGIISTPPDTIPAIQIGYGQQPATTLIDHVFTYKNATDVYQIPSCSKGEFIGNFSDKVGLDVVLDYGDYELTNQDELFRLDLAFARSNAHVLTIPTGTAAKIKQYREHILQFMDAAALWGSHINCGTIETVHGDKKTAAEIGNDILSKYFTKDKVYVYIQGEHDRSYNYYDTVRKVYGFNPAGELAKTNEWPILIKQISMTSDDKIVNFQLDYTIDANIPKIQRHIAVDVFAANGNKLDKIYPRIERPDNTTDKTQAIDIKFYGNISLSCASFLFLYGNLKQGFPLVDYYNSLWTVNTDPVTPINTNIETAIYYTNYNRKLLVNLDDTLGSGASIQNKVVFDNGLNKTTQVRKKRRLYLAILQANGDHDDEYNGYNITEVTSGSSLAIRTSLDYLNAIYYKAPQEKSSNFVVYRGTFTDSAITDPINSLSLIHHQNILKKNSYYHLGITDEEYNKLIYDDPAPISTTPQYLPTNAQKVQFYLNEVTAFTHENIRKFELGLWYEDNTGVRITTAKYPTGTNKVYVYTMDGYFFFSKEYSDHQEFYNEFANTIVEFRTVPNSAINPPAPAYNGEFGFDWLRINDNSMDTRPTYENSILSGYERPHDNDLNTEYESKVEAYKALKREYKSIPTRGINQQYFIPYLNLFSEVFSNTISIVPAPAFEVYLRVYVDIKVNINKLEFDYDTNLFEIDKPVLSDKTPSTTGNKVESLDKTIKIKCLNDFTSFQQIRILEYPQGINNKNEAQLAGLIIMNKNNSLSRKELNFVYVKVMTNVDGSGNQTGSEYTDEVAKLINSISHSSVICKIENAPQILDLSANLDYQIGGTFVESQTNGLNEDAPNFFTNLTTLFLNDKDQAGNLVNSKYNSNYFTIFCFGYDAYDLAAGQIESIGKHNLILFPSRGNATLSHEGMHGLGLFHTHRDGAITNPNQKFTFYKYNSDSQNPPVYIDEATDNYMSYAGNLRKTTWHWQWKIVRKNI